MFIIRANINNFWYYAKLLKTPGVKWAKIAWEGLKDNATSFKSKTEADVAATRINTNFPLDSIKFPENKILTNE
jgi:hypothetical protein